ncbi:MAG TPA: hypothetical protein VNU97_10420 [Rhizomicrobium sp.]|jgi:hypothetical protein|nr:hypothetical protein [Rhizomicrobium sp.]
MRGRHSTLAAIVLGGVIAGVVDIGAASAINGFINPLGILRFIAGGVLGLPAARAAGMQAAALGTALQIGMSLLIAAIFVVASNLLPVLKRHWLPAGLAFGVGVYFVMTYVVVPHSAIGHGPTFDPKSFALNLAAMLLFGTIIAWFARGSGR